MKCSTSKFRPRPARPRQAARSHPAAGRNPRAQGRSEPDGRRPVIEAKLDRGRGAVATVLVQQGTLRPGQIIVAGDRVGPRARSDQRQGRACQGSRSVDAGRSPRLSGTPQAGDKFAVVENESRAREISEYRQRLAREKAVARQSGQRGSLEQMMMQLQSYRRQGIPAGHQGRRAGLDRSHCRRAEQARNRRSPRPHRPFGRRRHHRVRHLAGRSLERHHHRLQRPRQQAGPRLPPSATASRSATTTSSTTSWMT